MLSHTKSSVVIKAKTFSPFQDEDIIFDTTEEAEANVLRHIDGYKDISSNILGPSQVEHMASPMQVLKDNRDKARCGAMVKYSLFAFEYKGCVPEFTEDDIIYNDTILAINRSYDRGWAKIFAQALFYY